jgi:hypothetical protein
VAHSLYITGSNRITCDGEFLCLITGMWCMVGLWSSSQNAHLDFWDLFNKIILGIAQMLVLLTLVYPIYSLIQPKLEIEDKKRITSQANCHKCKLLDKQTKITIIVSHNRKKLWGKNVSNSLWNERPFAVSQWRHCFAVRLPIRLIVVNINRAQAKVLLGGL